MQRNTLVLLLAAGQEFQQLGELYSGKYGGADIQRATDQQVQRCGSNHHTIVGTGMCATRVLAGS